MLSAGVKNSRGICVKMHCGKH